MYAPNELMFPRKYISVLRTMRGPQWQALVERVMDLPDTHEDVLALMLMMIRLNGCMECETDSYRAMRGCDACALQTLRRFKGKDDELVLKFEKALDDIRSYIDEYGISGITAESFSLLKNAI